MDMWERLAFNVHLPGFPNTGGHEDRIETIPEEIVDCQHGTDQCIRMDSYTQFSELMLNPINDRVEE